MKDWKGNSNSATYSLGIKRKSSTNVREKDDFYATDPIALQQLLDSGSDWFLNILKNCTGIWECACGCGNLAECLRENGYDVAASDLKDRGYGLTGKDFLKTPASGFSVILTNPPYSLADEFILHALNILPNGGLYIALMNINYLAGIKRYDTIFSINCLKEIYVFKRRISCWKNNIKDQSGHMLTYAWYVFQKGFKGQPTIYWL